METAPVALGVYPHRGTSKTTNRDVRVGSRTRLDIGVQHIDPCTSDEYTTQEDYLLGLLQLLLCGPRS
jgi:hypothetical protein